MEDNARPALDTARARVQWGMFRVLALALGRRAVASSISLMKHRYVKLFLGYLMIGLGPLLLTIADDSHRTVELLAERLYTATHLLTWHGLIIASVAHTQT